MKHSSALPLARTTLRTLITLNWLFGAGILLLLIATFVAEQWTFTALGLPPSSQIRATMIGLRAIAVLGLVAIPLNHAVLRRLVAITEDRARRSGRAPDSFEFQMLYGIRPNEQQRLVAQGQRVRVYVPYGDEWYGYLVRRMAERPANLAFFLRSVATKG